MNLWMLLAVALGLLIGALLMVLTVHPGIDLLRWLIGRDRCFGSEALNGCATWGNGTLLCGGFVLMTWRDLGFWSLMYVPLVPVAAVLFWTLCFTLRAKPVRKREFVVTDAGICSLNGERVDPEYVIRSGSYDQTGPATGYAAALVQLGRGQDSLATNVYIDTELADRALDQVIRTAGPNGCRLLDVCFVTRTDDATWHVVRFNAPWTPLLCGALEKLSESDRAWWRQWCRPEFGAMQRTHVASAVILEHLERLVEAYPSVIDRHPVDGPEHDRMPTLNLMVGAVRLRDNVRSLKSLLARHSSVQITTWKSHHDEIESVRTQREAGIECSFTEDGIEVQTMRTYR